MTDRLSTLLHDEAAGLDVPLAPADRVLADGRSIRHRRRTTVAVIGAAAAVVVVAAGIAVLGADRTDRTPEPVKRSDILAYQELGAWISSDDVHVGKHVVTVPGAMDLHYTSVGVVVSSTDDTQTLVRPDGAIQPLDLELPGDDDGIPSDRVATDVAAPYLAYVRAVDGDSGQLTVRDLTTGEETVASEPFRVRGGSIVNSLWDDQVLYARGRAGWNVDWRSGERLPLPSTDGFVFQFGGYGHGVLFGIDGDTEEWIVSSRTDGRRLLAAPTGSLGSATVSPDGRYLAVTVDGGGIDVYAVTTGDRVRLGGTRSALNYGWTPDGNLVGRATGQTGSEVEVCGPVDGTCRSTGLRAGDQPTFVSAGQGTP